MTGREVLRELEWELRKERCPLLEDVRNQMFM